MEEAKEYLTIKEALDFTGKSEVTIRRFIRLLRSQCDVKPDDSNEQIAEKTLFLRKQNEGTDVHEEPVFQWLIARSKLADLVDDSQSSTGEDGHDDDQQSKDRRHGYTKTLTVPVAMFESLNDTIDALREELGEKNKQIERRDKRFAHQQGMLGTVQEKVLNLPSGTIVKRIVKPDPDISETG